MEDVVGGIDVQPGYLPDQDPPDEQACRDEHGHRVPEFADDAGKGFQFLFKGCLGCMVDPERCGDHPHLGRVTDRSGNHLPFSGSDECSFQDAVPQFFWDGLALPGKCGFIGKDIISSGYPAVSGYGITGFEKDQVADNDITRRDRGRVTVPDHLHCHIIPGGIQDIEFPAAPVLVEECDTG